MFAEERPNGKTHKGVDINHIGGGNTDKGAPIVATHDGTVTKVVTEGQQIGIMGGSGKGKSDAYTSHLHYEIKIDGEKVNPAISSTNLIDPQQLITPLNGGALPYDDRLYDDL